MLSSENGRSIRLGSVLSMPLTAARPLRSARRTSQVCALTVASLKVGLAAWLSCQRQLSSFEVLPCPRRDRTASREERTDRTGRLGHDAVDLVVFGDLSGRDLLRQRRIPIRVDRALKDVDPGVRGKDFAPADGLRRGHRIARRAALHDHVALAVQRLDHPFGKRLADTDLGFGYAREIIFADLAERSIAGGKRNDRDAGVQRLTHDLAVAPRPCRRRPR